MSTRSTLVLGLAVSGAVALATIPATWLSAVTDTVAGQTPIAVTGSAVPLAGAGALVVLAAAAALLLASPVIARVAGAVAALLGATGAVTVGMLVLSPRAALDEAARAATGLPWTGTDVSVHVPAYLALLALSLGAIAGVAAVILGSTLGQTSQRFERTAPETTHARSMDDWDALGRGEDPSSFDGTLGSEGG